MLKNYLIIAVRNLWKHRTSSVWNIFGLALGIGCASLIFLLVRFELSFDQYHTETENMYRVVLEDNAHGGQRFTQAVPYPLPVALREDFQQIEYLTIVDANVSSPVITVFQDQNWEKYREERGFAFVEPDYFQLFTRDWVLGNQELALKEQKTVVLSESLAAKYFGVANPLGQVLNFNNQYDLKVTGVIKDAPANTDLPFNMLISMNLGEEDKRGWEGWDASSGRVHCYLKLKRAEDRAYLDQQLENYFAAHWEEDFAKDIRIFLQPLGELHSDTRFANFNSRVVSKITLWAMGLIGLFLVATSCINFINLNTVLAAQRSKEIGVRKVLGGQRSQLVFQFLGETLLITVLAIVGALMIVRFGMLYMDDFLGYSLSFDLPSMLYLVFFLIGILMVVCLLAGLYPALIAANFQPIAAIKNKINISSKSGFSLRNTLVTSQLVISQVLVICTLVITYQLDFCINSPMGFNQEAILEFPLPLQDQNKVASLANALNSNPHISNFTFSSTGAASDDNWAGDFTFDNGSEIITAYTHVKFVDPNFIRTYGIEIVAGNNIQPADSANMFLVNESFVKAMGLPDTQGALGEFVTFWGVDAPVTGVVRDFNSSSLHHPIQACIYLLGPRSYYMGAAKVSSQDFEQTIVHIDEAWSQIYPDYLFQYAFLDDTIASFYAEEKKLSRLFKIFAVLAIIIGCIGLFGLVSFMTSRRLKEVGVRKVLGASAANITLLFSKHFLALTVSALLISIPISYYAMNRWLENFTYKIDLSFDTFLAAALLSILVVALTVGHKTLKTALSNPVNSLKYE